MRKITGRNRGRGLIAMLVVAVGMTGAVAAAVAEAPSRDDYVTQLERICRPEADATQRAMKGARADVRAERWTVAAAKFDRATSIFGSTMKQISAVPRPPADSARLKTWFGYLKNQESYLRQITAQLRSGRGIKAQRLLSRFIHNGNLANNVVLAFGFDYCSFKFSRYG